MQSRLANGATSQGEASRQSLAKSARPPEAAGKNLKKKRAGLNNLDEGTAGWEVPTALKEIVFMKEKFMGADAAAGLSVGAGVVLRSSAGVQDGGEPRQLKNKMSIADFNSQFKSDRDRNDMRDEIMHNRSISMG